MIEAVIASVVGTTIEWYDFFLYGTAAATVFPKVFFPRADEFTGQILAFGTFTVGFVARPIGGIIFGAMGDRVGRKAALVATLLLMGISTLLVGFLPTFSEIGWAAPVLLTFFRFCQGLGVGGEWGGAVLLALEYGRTGRRGFIASWPQAGVPLGLLASTGVMAICNASLTEREFLDWGWRVPFYLSGLLVVVGLLIRIRIMETPMFAALRRQNRVAEAPVKETLRHHRRDILLVVGVRVAENACFYLFTASTISYGEKELGLERGLLLSAVNIAAVVALFTIPLFGMLSDRWTRRGIYIVGCTLLLLFAWPFYRMLNTKQEENIILAVVLGVGVIHAMLYSVQASLIPELFGTRLRCTGASLAYQFAAPLAGGIAPLVAAVLINSFPRQYWPLSLYVALLASISLVSVLFVAETSRKELTD
jgi:metabolite-proton symporter